MGKSSHRVNLTDSPTPRKRHTKTATPVTSTKSARPVKHTKQATRVYSLSKANNDLVDEVVSLRDRVNELETREQERTLGEAITGLKAAIAGLEVACTIERYAEMSNEMIQENFDAIKAKLKALEDMSSTIQAQNNDLLAQVSNLDVSGGGGGPILQSTFIDSSYASYKYYRSSNSSPTYAVGPQLLSASNLGGNLTEYGGWYEHGLGGILNQGYQYDWYDQVYTVAKFSLPAEVRANWAGITGATVRMAIVAYHPSVDIYATVADRPKVKTYSTNMSTTGYRNEVTVSNNILAGTAPVTARGFAFVEAKIPKEYFQVTDIDTFSWLEVWFGFSHTNHATNSSRSTPTSIYHTYFTPRMGLLPYGCQAGTSLGKIDSKYDATLTFDTTPLS